jgi:hypothetical protein
MRARLLRRRLAVLAVFKPRRRARRDLALYGVALDAKVSPRRRLDTARAGEGSARAKERESRAGGKRARRKVSAGGNHALGKGALEGIAWRTYTSPASAASGFHAI